MQTFISSKDKFVAHAPKALRGGAKRLATRLALASCARLPSVSTPIDLVELSGIEPLTPCLQSRCSPS